MRLILVALCMAVAVGCSDSSGYRSTGVLDTTAVSATAWCPEIQVAIDHCENAPGSEISIQGAIEWPGVKGVFVFRNNMKGTHQREEVVFTIDLIEAGLITFDKEPSAGGVGGNPHIWFQLTDEDGNAIGDEIYLGRCNQDGK